MKAFILAIVTGLLVYYMATSDGLNYTLSFVSGVLAFLFVRQEDRMNHLHELLDDLHDRIRGVEKDFEEETAWLHDRVDKCRHNESEFFTHRKS